jgi:hypothetical protein
MTICLTYYLALKRSIAPNLFKSYFATLPFN